jgi:hypothetical protein
MYPIPILGLTFLAYLLINAAIAAIGIGVTLLLQKKPKTRENTAVTWDRPTSMVGRAIPFVRGKAWVKSPNMLAPFWGYWYEKNSDGSYYFLFSVWMGVCVSGIDGIKQLKGGGKILWPTAYDSDVEATDGTTTGYVSASYAFGGRGGEGGQNGNIQILYGGAAQTLPARITNFVGADYPQGRGIVSILFGTDAYAYYWGTTTYPKWPSFLVKSVSYTPRDEALWQSAYAEVGDDEDFNPIHSIYEWLTDPQVGRGFATTRIGSTFAVAAATLHGEDFGISYVLDYTEPKIQDWIDMVCEIMDGFLYFDPSSGTWEISLSRPDYDPDDLEEFDQDDFYVSQFHRPSPGEIPSKCVVKFTRRDTGDVDTATDEDNALRDIQGGRHIIEEFDYSEWICTRSVAEQVAAREQKALSSMGADVELVATRTMSHLHQGSLIKISYPALGIASMIIRVLSINKGDLFDGKVVIKGVEDVFGTVYTVYGTPEDPASGPDISWSDATSIMEVYTSATESAVY